MEKLYEGTKISTKNSLRSDETTTDELKCQEESNDSESLGEFFCTDCNERFWDEGELMEHTTRHSMGLICSICGYEAVAQSNMISHSRGHLDLESVRCLICKERMVDKGQLEMHIREHVRSTSTCPWCPYISAITSELQRHIDQHLKKYRINCNFCKYYSFCEEDLRVHSELHSNDECKPRFKVSKKTMPDIMPCELSEEMKFSDLLERAIFRCGLCGLRLPSEEAFETHLREHVRPGIAYCPHCSYQSDDREKIMTHVLAHIEETASSVTSGEIIEFID